MKPEKMEVLNENIPKELTERNLWIVWRWELRDGKWTKPPYNPNTGEFAKSTDPNTWVSFNEALEALHDGGDWDGLGFMLIPPYCGIDWDDSVIPGTGDLHSRILSDLKKINSYSEYSPSGKGVKTLCKASLPKGGHHTNGIGIFQSARYFCITGHTLPGVSQRIEDRQEEVESFCKKHWPGDFEQKKESLKQESHTDDAVILERIRKSKQAEKFNRLWLGDVSGFPSPSEADLALCSILAFWCANDASQIDRLFRQSGLVRKKWEKHGYGARTIAKAISMNTEIYIGQGGSEPQKTGTSPLPDGPTELSDEEKSELLFKDFSDTENARRFLKFNGNTFLWIEDLQRWWHYDSERPGWGDGEMAVRLRMKETANLINKLALAMPFTDDKQRLEKLKQCISWKDANGIENSIKMLRDESFAQSTEFDTNPFLFLCKSGPINLKTGKRESLKPSDYLHKLSQVIFDKEAKCPQWKQFLNEIFMGDQELIFFVQKYCGYTLTGDTREEKFLILEGPGANGKSTLLEVIAGVLGEYGVPIPFATFKDPKWDQSGNAHQADMVQMIGARFIRSVEVKERARLNIERLKSLTGNDEMSARPPHARDYIRFKPIGKIWLAVNHLPKIYDTTNSCWRRLLRVPFSYVVPQEKRIKDFSKKLLREEGPGILNWMLDGCYVWQAEGLEPIPPIVTDATTEYQAESTPVKRFVSEKCEIGKFQVAFGDLYTSFFSWWKDEMGEVNPISKIEMGKELKRIGFDMRIIKNVKHYIGLRQKIEFD